MALMGPIDLLLAARQIGSNGRAIGVDMTVAMRERVIAGARGCGLTNVDVRDGDATNLPVEDSTVDVVISNGVLNLVPDRTRAVREIARVLKRGGRAVRILDRFDCFVGTTKERTAKRYGVVGVNLTATRS